MNKKIDISVIIPAFNESKRLPPFLDAVISYCKASRRTYEIIIVSDGSTDDTFEIALSYAEKFNNLQVIRLNKNRGKGNAVKTGVLKSSGEVCVFLDADGSVSPDEIERNLHYLGDGYDIFSGSRVLRSETQVLKVKFYRKAIGCVFNFLVHCLLFNGVKDPQCGFKMFKRDVAKVLFSRSYIPGYGFDVEILYLAFKVGYKIKEGPVSWRHVKGGKVNLLVEPVRMFVNIFQIRNRRAL